MGLLLGLVVVMLRLLLLLGSGDGGEIFCQLILAAAEPCALSAGRLDVSRRLTMLAVATGPWDVNDHGLAQNLDGLRGDNIVTRRACDSGMPLIAGPTGRSYHGCQEN